MDMQNKCERQLFLEHICKSAEATYALNPLDNDNLIQWAGCLLELSQYKSVSECVKMIYDAISKLEEALSLDSKKHEALWTLGNALNNLGLIIPNEDEAKTCFDGAVAYLQKAITEDPGNELYAKSLQLSLNAPHIHKEIYQQAASVSGADGSTSSRSKTTSKKKNEDSDLVYDICGWIILGVVVFAWFGFAKSQSPLR